MSLDERACRTLFDELVPLPPAQRRERLARVREDDASLADEVGALLDAMDSQDPMLGQTLPGAPRVPATFAHDALAATLRGHPTRVGKYRPVRVLGEGGMGVVYEAQQQTPKRTIALKLIRPELVTPALQRRFAFEADVLAQLQHPCIAQLYDADLMEASFDVASSAGTDRVVRSLPAIAMELVQGKPITIVARENEWSVRRIAAVFARVCEGVDHAHKRGVIHRDLKPANILVQPRGTIPPDAHDRIHSESDAPKVLDFGVARLTGKAAGLGLIDEAPALEGSEVLPRTPAGDTLLGQVVGTLAYMAPEQARGDNQAIDIRTDVYALGVTLFELLTGKLPIAMDTLGMQHAVRAIQERAPARVRDLASHVAIDLDAIVAMALHKDPAKRYQSAGDLAEDLRRWLRNDVVHARRAGPGLRLRKFVLRHRAACAAIAGIALAIVAGVVATGRQAVIATRERNQALEQAQRAEATVGFLRQMTSAATPMGSEGRTITLRDVLDAAARDLESPPIGAGDLVRDGALPDHVRADLRAIFAEMYLYVGEFGKARELAALAHASQGEGPPTERMIRAMYVDGMARLQLEGSDEAEQIVREALSMHRVLHPGDHPFTAHMLNGLGAVVSRDLKRFDESVAISKESLEMTRRLHGDGARITSYRRFGHATVLLRQSRIKRAREQSEETRALAEAAFVELEHAVRDTRASFPEDHPMSLLAMRHYASALRAEKADPKSMELFEDLIPRTERVFGPNHESTGLVLEEAATTFGKFERFDRAFELWLRVFEFQQRVFAFKSSSSLISGQQLLGAANRIQRGREVIPQGETVLAAARAKHADTHRIVRMIALELKECYLNAGNDAKVREMDVILNESSTPAKIGQDGT